MESTGKHRPLFIFRNCSVLPYKQGFIGEGDEPLRPFGAPPLKRGGKAKAPLKGEARLKPTGVAFLAPPLGELARSA